MDLLERLIGHDLWTTSEVLRRCRELSDDQLDQEFDIDHRTVRATLAHMISNMEIWTVLMEPPPATVRQRIRPDTFDNLAERHRLAGERFYELARRVTDAGRLDALFLDSLEEEPPFEKPYGGAIAHVITHDMHHRAQLLYMLDKLGLRDLPEGDLLGWEMNYRFQS